MKSGKIQKLNCSRDWICGPFSISVMIYRFCGSEWDWGATLTGWPALQRVLIDCGSFSLTTWLSWTNLASCSNAYVNVRCKLILVCEGCLTILMPILGSYWYVYLLVNLLFFSKGFTNAKISTTILVLEQSRNQMCLFKLPETLFWNRLFKRKNC